MESSSLHWQKPRERGGDPRPGATRRSSVGQEASSERTPGRGEPFADETVVFGCALRRVPKTEVVVLAVERDDGAAGRLVRTVQGRNVYVGAGRRPRRERGAKTVLPFWLRLLVRAARRGQVRCFSVRRDLRKWARLDSNQRPRPYQGRALTN